MSTKETFRLVNKKQELINFILVYSLSSPVKGNKFPGNKKPRCLSLNHQSSEMFLRLPFPSFPKTFLTAVVVVVVFFFRWSTETDKKWRQKKQVLH